MSNERQKMAKKATKCSAADGVTQTFDFGYGTPLMVRADDFNALFAETARLKAALNAKLADHINGTPCAEIRHQQEIERLHEERFREAAEQQLEIERLRGCLLWLLWHHQGTSSPTGQPIRRALGIDKHAPMTEAQIETGQWLAQPPAQQERKPSAWAGFLGADLDKRMAPARELVTHILSAAPQRGE